MNKNRITLIAILLCSCWFITVHAQTVTDVDGNVYQIVKIGSQQWMQENLKTAHYRDGSPITELELATPWANTAYDKTGVWCYYQSNAEKNPTYGKLYRWYALTDPRGLCPAGWHVPSDDEFTTLINYLGGDAVAGSKLKAKMRWDSPNTGASNSSSFTAFPAGSRANDGVFNNMGQIGFFWSRTEYGAYYAYVRSLVYNKSNVARNTQIKGVGLSVRCVGD